MNTIKLNTQDTSHEQSKEFPYPAELNEEEKFLAEMMAEMMPLVRAVQAKEGGKISDVTKVKVFAEMKKLFKPEM